MLKNIPSIDIIVDNSHVYVWEEPLRQMWWEREVSDFSVKLSKNTLLVSLPAAIPVPL